MMIYNLIMKLQNLWRYKVSENKHKKRKFLKPIETAVIALLATSPSFAGTVSADSTHKNPIVQTSTITKNNEGSVVTPDPLLIKKSDAHFSTASHYSHRSHSSHYSHRSHYSHYSSSF
ncbi:hypothetical protein BE843_04685 [Legionella pneumophila subsp. pneumophila]|nr:hypothetical protein BE843_04685 [Legionella pneumophila subsp. pneumophila]AOW62215.1 hypothetical protein BE844_14100 [Legionella pneumophila subsp. pneumophila]AOW67613.1 hypothetical protein BE846_11855 [Legionella pneumophila subsp. pneumophila]